MTPGDRSEGISENGREPAEHVELAALADGSLPAERREVLEAVVAERADLAAALNRQWMAVHSVQAADVAAPVRLRAEIEARIGRHARSQRRRRTRFALGAAAATALCALAIGTTLIFERESGLHYEAAALASEGADSPAPAPDPAEPKLLDESVDGVAFPNAARDLGWTPVGRRSDSIDDRTATTVYYAMDGTEASYTIVSGSALDAPESAGGVERDDIELAIESADGEVTLTWTRDGQTCILIGPESSRRDLIDFATWRGDGAVPF